MRKVLWLVSALLVAGCARRPIDATPEGATRELLDRLEHAQGTIEEARAAMALLASPTRKNLTERARRASGAIGAPMAPEQMLAPGFFFPRFRPRSISSRIQGEQALVHVVGIDESSEVADIPCLKENGRWRVLLQLPPLPPIEKRQDLLQDSGAP